MDFDRILTSIREEIEFDNNKLESVTERRDIVSRLKKRYGASIEDIISYAEKLDKELGEQIKEQDGEADLGKEVEQVRNELMDSAVKLSKARKEIAQSLEKKVIKELRGLGMEKVTFNIKFENVAEVLSSGLDRIEFLISPNPGEETKALSKIASGGEMARIMLGLKTILAKSDRIPVLIFDEIDVGIGGRMAQMVGKKLFNLSQTHQIICITHLPQIAAFAQSHYLVEKVVSKGRTYTRVKKLSHSERVEELARMMGGKEVTKVSIQHAQELLEKV